jgi:hypothetical protein
MSVCEVIVRPATSDDINRFSDLSPKPSVRAWVAEKDNQIIALGGLALVRGRWFAFLDLKPEARQYKMHIMRSALRLLAQARADDIRYIYANIGPDEPKAEAWLHRLGFRPDPRCPGVLCWIGKK